MGGRCNEASLKRNTMKTHVSLDAGLVLGLLIKSGFKAPKQYFLIPDNYL